MRHRELILWLLAAAAAVAVIAVALPRVYPLLPGRWEVSAAEAEAIGLERLAELAELPADPYVVTRLQSDPLVERRMLQALGERSREELGRDPFLQPFYWQVLVYPPSASPFEWSHQAVVAVDGSVRGVRRNLPPQDAAGEIDLADARRRADETIVAAGFDLADFGEPQVRSEQLAARTDVELRYPVRRSLLPEGVEYGLRVMFLGDQSGGWTAWSEDPEKRAVAPVIEQRMFLGFGYTLFFFLLLPVALVPFVRKYHEGEVGVRRAVQLFLLCFVAGLLAVVGSAAAISQGVGMGSLPRRQTTWLIVLWSVAFMVLPMSLAGAVSWSVGESHVRERWGRKLAAFDALFRGRWATATVARSALRGLVLGLCLTAALLLLALPLAAAGAATPYAGILAESAVVSQWPGLLLLLSLVSQALPGVLVACLLYTLPGRGRLSLRGRGVVAALAAWTVIFPPLLMLPVAAGFPLWLVAAAVPVLVFAWGDLLAALLCGLVSSALLPAVVLLGSEDPWLQLQGVLPLAALALPLLVSVRQLAGGEEFAYAYDDVPPHVRRIAERERHRVELETARGIQSSILPDLPPQLAGVELAHLYRPATEVGGDFYDVLCLDDGRLAVAVGDVAGHGVSSGLVMSMVKSALAVQVTFEPEVPAVVARLNRMVFQSARRRLLTTLTYALLDPRRRELTYACAGHIFPYRVTARGQVHELESGDYPLGVRLDLEARVHTERIEPGDFVVLLSDGVVERSPERSDEPFGYGRLRDSLGRHAGGSPQSLVRGVLGDLESFSGQHPYEDDVTLLVLRLPA